ncbi:MAG: cysteine--tRNA ligase [Rhodospirillales bacterium]|nr:cysteine--tRNA ligase [Rhodospirillales bacterium]MBO6788494.1 cysteine--tRNA ligase [Rhodospirillales bacterium]
MTTPQLKIHDTLSREKRDFVPEDPANVRMYVCGPTVYDLAHIGNARPIVVFDVLARLLRHIYGADHVTYARNITDIDDKINARAFERGISIRELTDDTIEVFHADMAALNALPPDVEPRATDTIDEMIEMIQVLIDKGHAYAAEGHVLFNVPSMDDYGRLSRRNMDELIAGARVEVAPYKKDPRDFVLWKPSDPDKGEPGWPSPWSNGRPGWHIECSAMSKSILGETFDIHGGGLDLIFPHHENEIAQSRCAHDTNVMANYWMHNGYLMAEGEKMSKSLGNFYTVNELLDEFPGEAIRLLLLKTHYRQPLDFTKDGLAEAKRELDGFYQALRSAGELTRAVGAPEAIIDALADDLNTPKSVSLMHELLSDANRGNADALNGLVAGASILGLLQQDPEDWFKWQPKSAEGGLSDDEIDAKIAARTEARANKDFATSDAIRDELQAAGIILEDGAGGTTWRRG